MSRCSLLFGPAELLDVDPVTLRATVLPGRKVTTLRDLAERLTDGRLGAGSGFCDGRRNRGVLSSDHTVRLDMARLRGERPLRGRPSRRLPRLQWRTPAPAVDQR
jgi:3-methyladenine DNA glycosylase/8-oxoguanine DNA glycosylase